MTWDCQACNFERNEDSSKFCGGCGKPKPTTWVCASCNRANIPDRAGFCPGCGKPKGPPVCKRCGIELPEDAQFCMRCGRPVTAPKASPATPSGPSMVAAGPAQPQRNQADSDLPPAAIFAGGATFLWAFVMLYVAISQLSTATAPGSGALPLLGLWNLLVVALYVGIGIGIFTRKNWAWRWGIGSNGLNAGLAILFMSINGIAPVTALLLALELIILAALWGSQNDVFPPVHKV